MNKDERDRQEILAAKRRLFAGEQQRSTGSLFVTTLAAEAGVKRWLLTHKHTDLRDEFVREVKLIGSPMPPAERALRDEIDDVKRHLKRTRIDLRRALAGKQRYARAVQVLEMENAQLEMENAQFAERLRALEPGPAPLRIRPGQPAT